MTSQTRTDHTNGSHDADDFLRLDCPDCIQLMEEYVATLPLSRPAKVTVRPVPVPPTREPYSIRAQLTILFIAFVVIYFGGHIAYAWLKGWIS